MRRGRRAPTRRGSTPQRPPWPPGLRATTGRRAAPRPRAPVARRRGARAARSASKAWRARSISASRSLIFSTPLRAPTCLGRSPGPVAGGRAPPRSRASVGVLRGLEVVDERLATGERKTAGAAGLVDPPGPSADGTIPLQRRPAMAAGRGGSGFRRLAERGHARAERQRRSRAGPSGPGRLERPPATPLRRGRPARSAGWRGRANPEGHRLVDEGRLRARIEA